MHKAVVRRLETKSYFLLEGNQTSLFWLQVRSDVILRASWYIGSLHMCIMFYGVSFMYKFDRASSNVNWCTANLESYSLYINM